MNDPCKVYKSSLSLHLMGNFEKLINLFFIFKILTLFQRLRWIAVVYSLCLNLKNELCFPKTQIY